MIHGQTGSDRIWGEGQDDDLYGESGFDWLSGGTGDDGVLGDDGLLLTSRNGMAEPLYGLAATTQIVLSRARRQADDDDLLEPRAPQGSETSSRSTSATTTSCTAGSATTGCTAAPATTRCPAPRRSRPTTARIRSRRWPRSAYYTVGNVLQHGYRPAQPEEFRWYDENDPWRKIMVAPGIDFLLNFAGGTTATPIDDGQDVLFGDTGHDWLVGGTNHDRLWGGYGDDLLQADDNLDSTARDRRPAREQHPGHPDEAHRSSPTSATAAPAATS